MEFSMLLLWPETPEKIHESLANACSHGFRPAGSELRDAIISTRMVPSQHVMIYFPSELLAKVIQSLPYFDIVRAGMVSKLWSSVVREDPIISELLHKKACFIGSSSYHTDSTDVAVHPALQLMVYIMGDSIRTAVICPPSATRLEGFTVSDVVSTLADIWASGWLIRETESGISSEEAGCQFNKTQHLGNARCYKGLTVRAKRGRLLIIVHLGADIED
ncbi:hypothetical protein B0H14DRAFT_3124136 [Mycena olivaceomarginata]|nr:hypothetical protein B0H14DRAFT_3124136 [Mycena olivaceomarginata]